MPDKTQTAEQLFKEWCKEVDNRGSSWTRVGMIDFAQWLLDKQDVEKQSAQAEAWEEGRKQTEIYLRDCDLISHDNKILGINIEMPEKPTNPYKQ